MHCIMYYYASWRRSSKPSDLASVGLKRQETLESDGHDSAEICIRNRGVTIQSQRYGFSCISSAASPPCASRSNMASNSLRFLSRSLAESRFAKSSRSTRS